MSRVKNVKMYDEDDVTLFESVPGYPDTLIPNDQVVSLREAVRVLLYNIDHFDAVPMKGEVVQVGRQRVAIPAVKTHRQKFLDHMAAKAAARGWSHEACSAVSRLMRQCPPDRVYRVRGGFRSSTTGVEPIGCVVDYRPGVGGSAEAAVVLLGAGPGELGSGQKPLPVPAEGLEDVTEDCRTATLRELRLTPPSV